MIRSSKVAAEIIATKMASAAHTIEQATNTSIATADKTTLAVNHQAQEANQEAMKLAQAFHESFQQTIEDLRSVANEFEKIDQELNAMNEQYASTKFMEDLETYTKAKNG